MQNKKPQMIIYKSFEVFRQYPEPVYGLCCP